MAKLEQTLTGNFDDLLRRIEDGIIRGSVSASLEDGSDFKIGTARSGFPPSLPEAAPRCFIRSTRGERTLFSRNCGKFSDAEPANISEILQSERSVDKVRMFASKSLAFAKQ